MSSVNVIKQALARIFSLEAAGATPREKTKRFVIACAAWILVIRVVLVIWAIVFPDSRQFDSFTTVSIAPWITFGPGVGFPSNDSYFYWLIATNGFYEAKLVNFSPILPAILFATRMIFQEYAPFIINSVFAMLTPWFLFGFLTNVIKDEAKVKQVTVLILFNPLFIAYSIYGMTEPLHYLLLFVILASHYKKGLKWRIVEYACLVVLVLNRFISVVLAVFYAYKALFRKGSKLKERIIMLVPVAVMGGTYLGWELLCRMIFPFGISPSEARRLYWGHDFNFNPLAPDFMANQAPLLLAGAILGLLVLKSTFSKDDAACRAETAQFERLDMQALLAFAAVTFLFLGLMNKPVSILRYTGTSFPIIMILAIKVPSSKLIPIASFGIAWGMVIAHAVMMAATAASGGFVYFTATDLVLVTVFTAVYLIVDILFYIKRDTLRSMNVLLALHVLLALLLQPLTIFFP